MVSFSNDRTVSVLSTERLHSGFLTLDKVQVRIERPGKAPMDMEREIHDHGQVVSVLPYDPVRGTAVVVRQLRVPLLLNGEPDPFLMEACAGIIDPEDGSDETACRREAQEETGLALGDLQHVTTVYTSPGALTESIRLYLGVYSDANRVHDGGGHDADEDIDVIELPLADLADLQSRGAIMDAKLLILIQTLMLQKPELFRG
ncbi:NUDIX domain-containing protein [Amorphus orientalis]|uniref:GDP-mannose pyrophosphatase n=1 Tax=Amorphus orientalis TaxID=649198 RepID=A0AAE3VNE8_9HYPH|nr:NUDIX domain-containing protein [Amorphus orientalis]MDQ0315241.1 nudix-type nucleoside diphosphatase (YffH/AdpP family) [Amorphus orientalis]